MAMMALQAIEMPYTGMLCSFRKTLVMQWQTLDSQAPLLLMPFKHRYSRNYLELRQDCKCRIINSVQEQPVPFNPGFGRKSVVAPGKLSSGMYREHAFWGEISVL